MSKNCDAMAHRHSVINSNIPHLVAIYYYDAPEGGAELIFIDDNNLDVMEGGRYFEYPESKQFRIKPKTGMLVCHDAMLLHAVSTHKTALPRTCIIIEVGFPPKN